MIGLPTRFISSAELFFLLAHYVATFVSPLGSLLPARSDILFLLLSVSIGWYILLVANTITGESVNCDGTHGISVSMNGFEATGESVAYLCCAGGVAGG